MYFIFLATLGSKFKSELVKIDLLLDLWLPAVLKALAFVRLRNLFLILIHFLHFPFRFWRQALDITCRQSVEIWESRYLYSRVSRPYLSLRGSARSYLFLFRKENRSPQFTTFFQIRDFKRILRH